MNGTPDVSDAMHPWINVTHTLLHPTFRLAAGTQAP
jgi:hypothetical protein